MQHSQKPYCLMPWIHFHVGNQGRVNACCVASIPYGNIHRDSFAEIWHGKNISALRQTFLAGKPDKRCAACTKLEASGGKSIRQETLEKFGHNVQVNQPSPRYFDIRFSNTCNFSCRTCWHGASSGWFTDAKKLKRNLGDKAIIPYIDDFDAFIDKMGKYLCQAEEIYFAGGEPLVTQAHYALLRWLIDNKATTMRLRYNSNFSVLNWKGNEVLRLWKEFQHVEVLASVDASGLLGEYIRKGFSWPLFLHNRETIRQLPHVQFKLAPTVSVFNVLHLPVLYQTAVENNIIQPDGFYTNMLHRPHYFNIQCLPLAYKKKVELAYSRFLAAHSLPDQVKNMFTEIISYLFAAQTDKQWKYFLKETETLDTLRKEKLASVLCFD